MTRILSAVLVLALAAGCTPVAEPRAERPEPISNAEFSEEVLFTDSQGYTVKRFFDKGQWRYYVTPGPSKVVDSVDRKEGKTTVIDPREIPTAEKKP